MNLFLNIFQYPQFAMTEALHFSVSSVCNDWNRFFAGSSSIQPVLPLATSLSAGILWRWNSNTKNPASIYNAAEKKDV